MDKEHKDPYKLDLTNPRLAWCKQKTWKKHQETVYWVGIKLAQREGFKFYQTRCNAIILFGTLPAYCIPKVMVESGEVIYEKVYVSPPPPPKISFKDNWMKELGSEVAGSSKDTQRIQPKPKTELSRTVRPVGEQSIGLFTQREEIDIDFRVSGLPHAVLKQAENFRVRELVKKIESHPHREALQAELQQNNVYVPFSNSLKAMIRERGNVERRKKMSCLVVEASNTQQERRDPWIPSFLGCYLFASLWGRAWPSPRSEEGRAKTLSKRRKGQPQPEGPHPTPRRKGQRKGQPTVREGRRKSQPPGPRRKAQLPLRPKGRGMKYCKK